MLPIPMLTVNNNKVLCAVALKHTGWLKLAGSALLAMSIKFQVQRLVGKLMNQAKLRLMLGSNSAPGWFCYMV